jgi:hypothetical protein
MKFEQRKGSYAIGAHVRDAACYIFWSFARAFNAQEIEPFALDIAKTLVSTSLFDREIQVRRAASAAFQENVGRLGIYPHGIHIVTLADYFNVGNRQHSFTSVAVEIAQLPEYRFALIDFLAHQSVRNLDKNIRLLAGKSLYHMCLHESKSIIDRVLFNMVALCQDPEVHIRHGALIAISEIVAGTPKESNEHLLTEQKEFRSILQLVSSFKAQHLTSFGSDLIRSAICRLISSLSQSNWLSLDKVDKPSYWQLIHTTLERDEEWLQLEAAETLGVFSEWIQRNGDESDLLDAANRYVSFCSGEGKETCTLRGYALGLGHLAPNLSYSQVTRVFQVLLGMMNQKVIWYSLFMISNNSMLKQEEMPCLVSFECLPTTNLMNISLS